MKYLICVLVVFISAEYCTAASLLPFNFNPFPDSSLNNAESTTQTDQNDSSQISGTSESSNSQEGQPKLADLPELLMTPLNILQLLFGPHNSHSNGGFPGIDFPTPTESQPQSHPGFLPGLPIQLPIPLIGLPNLMVRNNKQSSSETGYTESSNSEEKSSNGAKN